MSVNLTETQLVMMSAAAQRKDRCLSAPARIKGAVLVKVGAKLAKLGLAREIEAKPGAPIWRRDDTGQAYALKLTVAGLKAIAGAEGIQTDGHRGLRPLRGVFVSIFSATLTSPSGSEWPRRGRPERAQERPRQRPVSRTRNPNQKWELESARAMRRQGDNATAW